MWVSPEGRDSDGLPWTGSSGRSGGPPECRGDESSLGGHPWPQVPAGHLPSERHNGPHGGGSRVREETDPSGWQRPRIGKKAVIVFPTEAPEEGSVCRRSHRVVCTGVSGRIRGPDASGFSDGLHGETRPVPGDRWSDRAIRGDVYFFLRGNDSRPGKDDGSRVEEVPAYRPAGDRGILESEEPCERLRRLSGDPDLRMREKGRSSTDLHAGGDESLLYSEMNAVTGMSRYAQEKTQANPIKTSLRVDEALRHCWENEKERSKTISGIRWGPKPCTQSVVSSGEQSGSLSSSGELAV